MKIIKISNNEILSLLDAEATNFPKYATQILNLANQNAQGTRPSVVGQMSNLIQEFPGTKLKEWEEWYLNKYPEALSQGATKVFEMVENFKDVMTKIDKEMVEEWVKDLVILKNFYRAEISGSNFKKCCIGIENDLSACYSRRRITRH